MIGSACRPLQWARAWKHRNALWTWSFELDRQKMILAVGKIEFRRNLTEYLRRVLVLSFCARH